MALKERIESHQEAFDSLVQSIPAKYYFTIQHEEVNGRFNQKKSPQEKLSHKQVSKKAKKLKLDPESSKTVLEIQESKLKGEEEQESQSIDNENILKNQMQFHDKDTLKMKINMKIQEYRKLRNAPEVKAESRQELLEKRKKRKEEQKKALKMKSNRKMLNDTLGMAVSKPTKEEQKNKSDSGLLFSKVDFGKENGKKQKGPTDAASRLKQAEAKKQKLEEIRQVDAEKAESIEEKEQWKKLMQQAEGTVVKDDIKLLKKTVKRKEGEKKKSSVEWKNRKVTLEKDQKIKSKKREGNIQARIDQKKATKVSKKSGKPKPKKTSRPGFEGKKK